MKIHPRFRSTCSWGRCRRLLAIVLHCAFLGSTVHAERAVHWRVFKTADGLKDSQATAVTLSVRTNIWVKHGDAPEISVFDGYTVRSMASPGRDALGNSESRTEQFRIYESRTQQLWSLYTDGLVIYDGNQWVRHPIADIRNEIKTNIIRRVRQIPLIPVQQDRVLFLLSKGLMEYDAARRETTVLKDVAKTRLGRFYEMNEARDGGLWVTGANGLAKVTGPLRQINKDSAWRVELIREELRVENLQRPFEDSQGRVTTVGIDSRSSNTRVLLQFDGTTWHTLPAQGEVRGEAIRQAWPGWDQAIWAHTINSVLISEGHGRFAPVREPTWLGQHNDVTVESGGVFWLATSEGLVRCAPFPWRTPPELEPEESLVHAALEDAEGRLWFASTDTLMMRQEGQWKKFKWPENLEVEFQPTDGLYPLRDGKIAVAANDRPLVFDPATGRCHAVKHPAERKVRFIGTHKEKMVWAQASDSSSASGESNGLELFDGERFVPWLESPSEWALAGQLLFAREAQNGDIWFGGVGGTGRYRNGRLTVFGPAQGFVAGRANCLLELPDGKIWVGGVSKVLEFDGQRWTTVRAGLERVSSMIRARNGKIWVATAAGLYTYWDGSWVMNGVEEGLLSSAISKVLEDRDERIWASSRRGISQYHPDADVNPPKTLPPRVNYPSRPSTEEPVTLVFNGVDKWRYTPAERLLFSHRLDEGQWSPYANVMVKSFENLRPGKHRLEARAMDRNWNQDPSFAFAEFSIVVPWYKEPRLIAISIGGAALVLFFAGLAVNQHLRLVRSYAEVERIVAVRTRELEQANQELLQSQKMRALGTLAAGIAHDFNNILSIIKGSAQIIESHPEDKEKIRTRINRIKTVVEQGSGIVKSMLGLSRVTEHDLVPCDLAVVVGETLRLLGDRALHDVNIRFAVEPSLPRILGAKELIQQMLVNLILNGVDAMMGSGDMVVRLGRRDELPADLALSPVEARSYVYVAAQDFGCGIESDILPRIFEPFFTTKALSKRRGTGLGLSMVYELAKEMGYGLRVESTVGKGSTFTIFMPALEHRSEA